MTEPYRVLVVDDHPDAAKTLGMLVRALGHECVEATTGGDALALAHAQRFDLAFVDLKLPDMTGHDVARGLRALPAGPLMFLIAASGYGQPEDRSRALAAGFDHHVLKPLDVPIVRRIIMLAERAAAAR